MKAAEIEAEAIRNAARASAQSAGAVPAAAHVGRTGSVDVPGERYRNLTGIWSWKGNARNRKFELTQEDDGVLSGRTFQTVKTQTGNDEKRFRDFQLSISRDGESLVGTIIDASDKNNREKRLDVIWIRVRD